jgi:MFS transporter, DHA2 family, multidrug resistance protein
MSGVLLLLAPASHHAAAPCPACTRPVVGLAAVLLGSVISTLFSRITSFGLADLRGAIGASFDEGAWITTAATVGQMCIGPIAAWLGVAFGPRRVLMISAGVFGLASALIPFSPNLTWVLVGQAVAGLSSGTFIPLTIGFVLQSMQPALWPFGIAAYGLNLELSLNVPASLEGWYIDHLSWHWIFWQGALLSLPMLFCIHRGMPRQPINRDALRTADGWGMFFAAAGFSMLYAALDQGNRLDWLNSGTIVGLLLGAGVLIAAFIVQIFAAEHPWIMPRFLLQRNIALLMSILVLYRFIILSTSYVIPQYLTTVQNFRSLDVGKVLAWIALPQFLLGPAIAVLLRWLDPRYLLALGLWCVGIACFMASFITEDWATDNFLVSQVLQAFGQSAALISFILFAVRHLRPADAMTFGWCCRRCV